MSKNRRKSHRAQPGSEPRAQSGVVESAKRSLMRASSVSPTSGTRPVEIEPGKVASARQSLMSTFAANADMPHPKSSVGSPKVPSASDETVPRQDVRVTPVGQTPGDKSKSPGDKAPSSKGSATSHLSSRTASNQVNPSSEETMPYTGSFQFPKKFAKGNSSTDSQAKKELFVGSGKFEPLADAPLAQVLHCKAIVFAYLPYDTLCNLTPLAQLHSQSQSVAQADWVAATTLLKAIRTGKIQEPGKADKMLQEVQDPQTVYAHDLLVDLLADTSRAHSPRILMRQVHPLRYPNVWCYPAGTHACVDDGGSIEDPLLKEVAKLSILVNRQTGYQMSRSNWEHYQHTEDTAANLGIHASLLAPDTPVHENVYIKEVIAPTPVVPTPPHSPSHSLNESSNPDGEDSDESSEVSSDPSLDQQLDRCLTGLVYSTLSYTELDKASEELCLGLPDTTKVLWISGSRYLRAIRTGVVFKQSERRALETLEGWTPSDQHGNEAWFAKRTIHRMMDEAEQAKESLKFMLVQHEGETSWTRPFYFLVPDDMTPQSAFVECIHGHLPRMALDRNRIDVGPIEFFRYATGEQCEVQPCYYEWCGEVIELSNEVNDDPPNNFNSSNNPSDHQHQGSFTSEEWFRMELEEKLHERDELAELRYNEQCAKLQSQLDSFRKDLESSLAASLEAMQRTLASAVANAHPQEVQQHSDDNSEALGANATEAEPTLTYQDGQLPNKWVHPHLDMFQDQFLCQYAHSVTDNPSDHQIIWTRMADKCALDIKCSRLKAGKACDPDPAPKGMICALQNIPSLLGFQSAKPLQCDRCGRMGYTRVGMVSVKQSNRTADNPYSDRCEQNFCSLCTNTTHLSEEYKRAMLCAAGDKYVVCYNPALVEDKSRVNDSYLSFENHPKHGRCMQIGSDEFTLHCQPKAVASSTEALKTEPLTPAAKPSATKEKHFIVATPATTQATAAVSSRAAVRSPSHAPATVGGGGLKISRSDVQKIQEHARGSAEKFDAVKGNTTYVHDVERFGMLMYEVRDFMTTDRTIALWLEDPQCVEHVSAVHILAAIADVVAKGKLKLTIKQKKNFVAKLSKPDVDGNITLEQCLTNFAKVFGKQCFDFDSCLQYVQNEVIYPRLYTFDDLEQHFRRAAIVTKTLNEVYGMTRVPEEDEGLVEWIHRALPRKTQLKLNDKLRMQAVNPETDMHMSKVTFEWLRETCHVVELELKKSASQRSYLNSVHFEGGEEDMCEECEDDDRQTANTLNYVGNRFSSRSAQRTRSPPRKPGDRSRSPSRNFRSSRYKSGLRTARYTSKAMAIVPYDPVKNLDACLNCGNPGHRAAKCTQPRDPARFKANLDLYVKHKQSTLNAERIALLQECPDDEEDQHLTETDPDVTEDEGSDLEDDQSEEDEVPQGRAKGATK